jgi:hypothetical protein
MTFELSTTQQATVGTSRQPKGFSQLKVKAQLNSFARLPIKNAALFLGITVHSPICSLLAMAGSCIMSLERLSGCVI